MKEVDALEKDYLINIADEYSEFIVQNHNTLLAKIYGLFSLKFHNRQAKMYFIIMQNLDIFQSGSVIFKYDLKFSQFNRKHMNTNDYEQVKAYLINQSDDYQEILYEVEKEPDNDLLQED
jgi:Phosphatidylinositol-4-phosphate 5-Kinase